MDILALTNTLKIPAYSNKRCDTIGMDSFEQCFRIKHFTNYPKFDYHFNSLGYRTSEPETWTGREILVIGDSFTLGLGCAADDIYSTKLQHTLNYPVLNFSLNGASNDWIARRFCDLLNFFDPPAVVIHYTFSHRREQDRSDWFDDERTLCEPTHSDTENFDNWQTNYQTICATGCNLVHSFIPNWHTQKVDYTGMVAPISMLDFARDSFHYGPKTHLYLTTLLADELRRFL